MILVDSDVIMDGLANRANALQTLLDLNAEGLAVSTTSIAEVLEGAYRSSDPPRQLQTYGRFFSGYSVLDVTAPIADRFAEIRARLRRQGNMIADMDLLIAATALVHDLTLLTGNARHFSHVPGLRLHQPAG
ncbi:MAG: type II toxin-antitoxin system VapC family toxin [Thermomicrobiales bacterium]